MNNRGPKSTTANRSTNTYGVDSTDRQQLLLDDLRVEVARLADAVERQNKLIEQLDDAESEVVS